MELYYLCTEYFRGMYEIQPKSFINYVTIVGAKIKISVQPDPTRPSDLSVEYNTKTVFIAGEKMPGNYIKKYNLNTFPSQFAFQLHLSQTTDISK